MNMKNYMIFAAAAAAVFAVPAAASDFTGPRLEVTAGADDVTNGVDPTEVTYGVGVGYDIQVSDFVLGVDAAVDNVFDRRDVGVGARLGYVVNDNVLAYGKVGYANWRQVPSVTVEGLRLGGGLEVNLSDSVFTGVEYRYTDFGGSVGKHGGLVRLGYRF